MDLRALSATKKAIGGTAALVVLAAFLPWVSVFGISASGISGDGKLTLLLALVTLAAVGSNAGATSTNISDRVLIGVSGVCGVIVVLIALFDMNSYAASGLWLTLLAGIGWIGAVVVEARRGGLTVTDVSGALRGVADKLESRPASIAQQDTFQVLPKVERPERTSVAPTAGRRDVNATEAGRSCPYCRFPLKEGTSAVECDACSAVHHSECWDDNAGCATVGCSGTNIAAESVATT